jgi:ferredoxin
MRVVVDMLKCESNGLCMGQAPDVFLVNDDDELEVLQVHPDESQRAKVLAAVKMCPKQALTLEG